VVKFALMTMRRLVYTPIALPEPVVKRIQANGFSSAYQLQTDTDHMLELRSWRTGLYS
jgi:hypothetical protein